MSTKAEATIDDLSRVPENGKAEIVNGELVLMSPTGGVLGRTAGKIYRSLDDYERSAGGGYAFPDNVGFIVETDRRLDRLSEIVERNLKREREVRTLLSIVEKKR